MQSYFQHIAGTLAGWGPLGALAFVAVYALAASAFVSSPLLNLSCGALFGPLVGAVVASAGSTISAGGVFLVGRYFSRGWIKKKIAASKKVEAVDEAVGKEGWKMVAVLRQTAILPFVVMNYGLGLSKITFKEYIWSSWLGMMPGTVLYVYLGSLAGKTVLSTAPRKMTTVEWAFFAFSVAVTVGMSFYATSIVKKSLKKAQAS